MGLIEICSHVLSLPDSLDEVIPSIGHDDTGAEEEMSRSEAAGGQVSLFRGQGVSSKSYTVVY